MQITADLHLHSKYSRAVSPDMDLPHLADWATRKGLHLLATGDWTHPLWIRELQMSLDETAPGLYQLKNRNDSPYSNASKNKGKLQQDPYFLLATEISSIYTQSGRGRRVHTLVFAPNFATVEKINSRLASAGTKLISDGRPITGLSAKQLAELVLSTDPNCLIIPAHAWTPWYSVFGAFSGFDSLEEAFGDLAKNIFAIETGLSSDPAMNWQIKELDHRAIVSFSDAHSPSKIGREVTVFKVGDTPLSYSLIREAIINSAKQSKKLPKAEMDSIRAREFTSRAKDTSEEGGRPAIGGASEGGNPSWVSPSEFISHTIEFYPEEGKYHYTGHRACQVVYSPHQTQTQGTICPVCGRGLTIGVSHRVSHLSEKDRLDLTPHETLDEYQTKWYHHPQHLHPPYLKLVPLQEIIAEVLSSGVSSKKVKNEYEKLTKGLAPELDLLTRTDTQKIASLSGPELATAIEKVRQGDIFIQPGYDGLYGIVKIFPDDQKPKTAINQPTLF